MSHPVLWCPKPFFYAIGNTPPACFTKDLSPDESARVLLLGCGDPRSILYTIQADLGKAGRTLDFTCCDVEPAILARNIVLLTLIADGYSAVQCWRIFYHFFLDEDAQSTLRKQCQRLIEASNNITNWNESKYGRYLRLCTAQSLSDMRRHWQLYFETTNLPEAEKAQLKASFIKGMKDSRKKLPEAALTLSSMRSAAPVIHTTEAALRAGHTIFEMYWAHGTIDSPSLGKPKSPYPNPLFGFSLGGRAFYPHYASNPIIGYHLAHLYATSSTLGPQDVVEFAVEQFTAWCVAFKRRVDLPKTSITIRMFGGDCLAFCQSLYASRSRHTNQTVLQASPFGVTQISLSQVDYSSPWPKAPVSFNVIDTSNLIDHVGLLNLLVVTISILERKPWAVIQTNSLVRSTDKGPVSSALKDRAFADIPTLSLLLGVSPTAYLTPFTTHSNKHEIMLSVLQKTAQFHESISWRYPACVVAESRVEHPELEDEPVLLNCDAPQLGKFLFSVYLQMFLEENAGAILSNVGAAMITRMNIVHYNRASFAEFLAIIKSRVNVDWEKTMDLLLLLIRHDRSLNVGMNNYQDLLCQMYLRGVYTMDTIRWDYLRGVRSPGDLFDGWKDVPPVVCIVLEVPRSYLRAFEEMDREEIYTPVIYCELRGPTGYNMQTAVRPTFGRISSSGIHDERQVTIEEDQRCWEGDSSLIVSFDVQSWILTRLGGMTGIDFDLRTTPGNIQAIRAKTGREGTLFSTSLADSEHVYILRFRPNDPRDICPPDAPVSQPRSITTSDDLHRQITVVFDDSSTKITTMIRRDNVTESQAKERLANGAVVDVKLLADNALLASFDGWEKLFAYPFPVRGHQRKTRIARKSSYVEIEVPIRPHFENSAELSLNYFPIARTPTSFNLVNIHYLNLDALPTLPDLPSDRLVWLNTHLGLMLSDSERVAQRSQPGSLEAMGMLVNLKESIAHCFMNTSGLKGEQYRHPILGLNEPEVGIYCLIFVNALKLDPAENTVVLDACVIPATLQNMEKVLPNLKPILDGKASMIHTLSDEMRTWKTFLPALAERCRTWSHTASCEYRSAGIPASGAWEGVWDNLDSPLCSCGKGKNLGRFETMAEWKPLRSEATRIAIGPLFSFSFLEKSLADWGLGSPSSSSSPADKERCAYCGGEGKPKLLVCSRCKTAKYCSTKCQTDHWKTHKRQCTGS